MKLRKTGTTKIMGRVLVETYRTLQAIW